MTDSVREAAMRRMEMRRPDEVRMASETQQNAGGVAHAYPEGGMYFDQAALTEYPRMLYRKTDVPQYQDWADSLHKSSEEKMVINRFDGLLCETLVASSADDAERLAEDGWDISPRAAHGLQSGIVAATTAKDDEIARLRQELADARETAVEQPRRGRPPKAREETEAAG